MATLSKPDKKGADKAAESPEATRKVNPEIEAKIDKFMAENASYVDYLRKQPQEILVRKLCLQKRDDLAAAQKYNQKVLGWLNKPENTELKVTLAATLPPKLTPDKQEAMLASATKNYMREKGIRI
ncbi:MAG TPA: hypothetical protein VIS99_12735 [Terrimicrobiaceae bacterium]